jgi:hypothetical protein
MPVIYKYVLKNSMPPRHHLLQSLGLLTSSGLRIDRIDSSVADLCLFFLWGGSQTAFEEFDKLAFLKHVLSCSVGIILLYLLGLIYLFLNFSIPCCIHYQIIL